MAALVNLSGLLDDAKCFELVRQVRWPRALRCPDCGGEQVVRNGHDDTQPLRQRYVCRGCGVRFDDLSHTVLAGHHQPLKVWISCLYLMGLNLSNQQIAQELGLITSDVQQMTTHLRSGLATRTPAVVLSGEVEIDEAYVTAGHKGNPEAVREKGRAGRRNRLKAARGRGTLEKEKPPILGIVQRGGEIAIKMLANVKQATIKPLILASVAKGALIHTDEYDIYARLPKWGYGHKTVCHADGEYARDEDGDGFHEVHVNTIEGVWSLLRSWLRPHRGISQEKLPLYLAFFQFVHNARKRGKALLPTLVEALLAPEIGSV